VYWHFVLRKSQVFENIKMFAKLLCVCVPSFYIYIYIYESCKMNVYSYSWTA